MTSRRTILSAFSAFSAFGALSLSRLPPVLAADSKTFTLPSLTADKTISAVLVPADSQRLAVLEYSVIENLQALGLASRIKAAVPTKNLPWIEPLPADCVYVANVKAVDVETVRSARPDLIFISGRISRSIDVFKPVAPTVCLIPDKKNGWKSFTGNFLALADVFGRTAEAQKLTAPLEKRLAAVRKASAGERAAVLMMVNGRMMAAPAGGAASRLTAEFGFTNVKAAPAGKNAPAPRPAPQPGQKPTPPTQAEIDAANAKTIAELVQLKPSRIFVLNKDEAIGMENPHTLAAATAGQAAWKQLEAVAAGRVHELTHAAWYLADGGVLSMDKMLGDAERALGI